MERSARDRASQEYDSNFCATAKYIFNGFAGDELYDLAQDPYEMTNLAGDDSYRPLLEQMATRMWEIIRETNDTNMANAQYGTYRFAPVGPEMAGNSQ